MSGAGLYWMRFFAALRMTTKFRRQTKKGPGKFSRAFFPLTHRAAATRVRVPRAYSTVVYFVVLQDSLTMVIDFTAKPFQAWGFADIAVLSAGALWSALAEASPLFPAAPPEPWRISPFIT